MLDFQSFVLKLPEDGAPSAETCSRLTLVMNCTVAEGKEAEGVWKHGVEENIWT